MDRVSFRERLREEKEQEIKFEIDSQKKFEIWLMRMRQNNHQSSSQALWNRLVTFVCLFVCFPTGFLMFTGYTKLFWALCVSQVCAIFPACRELTGA